MYYIEEEDAVVKITFAIFTETIKEVRMEICILIEVKNSLYSNYDIYFKIQ